MGPTHHVVQPTHHMVWSTGRVVQPFFNTKFCWPPFFGRLPYVRWVSPDRPKIFEYLIWLIYGRPFQDDSKKVWHLNVSLLVLEIGLSMELGFNISPNTINSPDLTFLTLNLVLSLRTSSRLFFSLAKFSLHWNDSFIQLFKIF